MTLPIALRGSASSTRSREGSLYAASSSFGPGAQRWQIEGIAIVQHHRRGDALAPLRIGHTDDGTLGNRGMFAQRLLNLQRGNLVSARLENVDVRPAENAIDAVLDDRGVAGAKPAIAKGIARRVRLAPVFLEHARTADFDLARRARCHRLRRSRRPVAPRRSASGVPTLPGTRSPRYGFDSAMPISVMP